MVLIQGSAEFDDALAGGFYAGGEVGGSGFVEEQDDAIEFAFASAAGEREAHGLKKLAAADIQLCFHLVDQFATAIAGQWLRIE